MLWCWGEDGDDCRGLDGMALMFAAMPLFSAEQCPLLAEQSSSVIFCVCNRMCFPEFFHNACVTVTCYATTLWSRSWKL